MMFNEAAKQQIDKLYTGRKHVELTVGILQDGQKEIVHWNPDRKETPETLVYPVGSICKPFTASLLAKHMAEGKLDLQVPISEYLPELPPRYYPNLEKLATHTSGFTTQPYTFWTTLPFLLNGNTLFRRTTKDHRRYDYVDRRLCVICHGRRAHDHLSDQ